MALDLYKNKESIVDFRYTDFTIPQLIDIKNKKRQKVALGIPVLNEEETLGKLLDNVQNDLEGLIDSIAVFDSGSEDNSEKICKERGIPFVRDKDVADKLNLSSENWKSGKGFNLWASVDYFKDHDVLSWIDADIKNFDPRFIYGSLGPLIEKDNIQFSKGRYFRPESDNRVTRILSEPVVGMLFPQTCDFKDPLCGLFGGKVDFLKQLPFYTGYGVETATLIYALEKTSPSNIAQVYLGDLDNREHDNMYMGRMSGNIAHTVLEVAEELGVIPEINWGKISNTITQHYSDGEKLNSEVSDISDIRLPPISEMYNK